MIFIKVYRCNRLWTSPNGFIRPYGLVRVFYRQRYLENSCNIFFLKMQNNFSQQKAARFNEYTKDRFKKVFFLLKIMNEFFIEEKKNKDRK